MATPRTFLDDGRIIYTATASAIVKFYILLAPRFTHRRRITSISVNKHGAFR